jgi:hypothetical protein
MIAGDRGMPNLRITNQRSKPEQQQERPNVAQLTASFPWATHSCHSLARLEPFHMPAFALVE